MLRAPKYWDMPHLSRYCMPATRIDDPSVRLTTSWSPYGPVRRASTDAISFRRRPLSVVGGSPQRKWGACCEEGEPSRCADEPDGHQSLVPQGETPVGSPVTSLPDVPSVLLLPAEIGRAGLITTTPMSPTAIRERRISDGNQGSRRWRPSAWRISTSMPPQNQRHSHGPEGVDVQDRAGQTRTLRPQAHPGHLRAGHDRRRSVSGKQTRSPTDGVIERRGKAPVLGETAGKSRGEEWSENDDSLRSRRTLEDPSPDGNECVVYGVSLGEQRENRGRAASDRHRGAMGPRLE